MNIWLNMAVTCSTLFLHNSLAARFQWLYSMLTKITTTTKKTTREATYVKRSTLRLIRATVALEKQSGKILSVCLYACLNYLACKPLSGRPSICHKQTEERRSNGSLDQWRTPWKSRKPRRGAGLHTPITLHPKFLLHFLISRQLFWISR